MNVTGLAWLIALAYLVRALDDSTPGKSNVSDPKPPDSLNQPYRRKGKFLGLLGLIAGKYLVSTPLTCLVVRFLAFSLVQSGPRER